MKKFILTCSYLFIISHSLKAQDYKSDNLFPVYNQTLYKGNSDCKASVELQSKNNILQFIINVQDDSVSISKDWKNSDHVEIWFNMDTDSNDYFVYNKEFYGGGKITDENRTNFRNYLLENAKGNDSLIEDITKAELPSVKEINGMMHWAINLKDSTAFLYDQEYYLKLPITDEVKNRIKITPSISSNGYKVIIEFTPESLLFLRKLVNNDITFMVDIFDVDGIDNNLSVLSTVKYRKWGAPERFNHVSIKKPLTIKGSKETKNNSKKTYTFYHYQNNKWILYKRAIKKNKSGDLYYKFEYKTDN